MFSLCTNLKTLIIDYESLENTYKGDKYFNQTIVDLSKAYKLFFLCNNDNLNIEGVETIQVSLNNYNSFSFFLSNNQIVPMHTIIITSSISAVERGHQFNISTILLREKHPYNINHKYLPDVILNIKYLRKQLLEGQNYGNINEMVVENVKGTGFVYPIGEIKHQLINNVKANLIYSGRYFTSKDPRSYTHCLSNIILKLKNKKSYAINALAICLEKI
ncbi:hypothetical protein C2I05_02790 [Bacillus subtilis]|uniref:hypothetical protein n=1 Tax=Bacillus subtilis TaxID=1423 RepID=UPI00201E4038|nr:hypothetical protein [Bacillus subtilis]UQZ69534.1 hypothetical protein C2I05_02790 [Bacillus subtilis]